MIEFEKTFAPLRDTRARVIYYSCIAEPKNILEIAKIWGYKTSTYFYQKRSKEIIAEMEANKIVSVIKGARFQSNYDLVLEEKGIRRFFEKTNNEISSEIIIEKYDYEILDSQLEDPLFREFCLEKKPELKQIIKEIKITDAEIGSFLSLWKDLQFRKIFLSTDCLSKVVGDRRRLPEDPRELLFSMTASICESIHLFKDGGMPGFPQPYLWIDANEIFPLIVSKLESIRTGWLSAQLETQSRSFQNVYAIMRNKFMVYEGRSEVSSYHVAKFVDIMGIQT